MTLLWTLPKDWSAKDPITKEELNKISDDLRYLYNPSRGIVTVRGTGTNATVTSTSFVDLDAATYSLSVELSGGRDAYVEMQGQLHNATVGAFVYLDVFIDNSIYLSTLTGTPGAWGVWLQSQFVASSHMAVAFKHVIPAGTLSAGVHTFKPRWRVSAGTGTWFETTGVSQFRVGE